MRQVSHRGFPREGMRLRPVEGTRQACAGKRRRAGLVGPRRSLASAPRFMSSGSGIAYRCDTDEHARRTGWQRPEPHAGVERTAPFHDFRAAIIDHIEHYGLQPDLIGNGRRAAQCICEENSSEAPALVAAVHRDHREIDGRDTAEPGSLLRHISRKVVEFERMRVQRVAAENSGVPDLGRNPDPREVSRLVFPCGAFEKVVEAACPAGERGSVMNRRSSASSREAVAGTSGQLRAPPRFASPSAHPRLAPLLAMQRP